MTIGKKLYRGFALILGILAARLAVAAPEADDCCCPDTSPWAATAVEDGCVNDRMVITPSTAPNTSAAARNPIAIRSRMPRAITGAAPRGVLTCCPFQIDTHEPPKVLRRTEIGPRQEYGHLEPAFGWYGSDTVAVDL